MLDRIRELAVNGQWQEVIEQGGALLTSEHGLNRDDVAWVHLTVAAGYVNTATCAADWHPALHHARAAHECATPGSMRHTAALQKLSSILVDTGQLAAAEWFAWAYLKQAPEHPVLAGWTGYVLRDLGIIASRKGNVNASIRWYRKSLRAFEGVANRHEITRSRLQLAWAFSKAGRPALARLVMPETVDESLGYYHLSALAMVSAAEGHWSTAVRLANRSLELPRPSYDHIDAADICMLASRAARRHGVHADAPAYERRAKGFAALQGTGVQTVLTLETEQKGGDFPDAKAALSGSADLHDGGCFTTGVA